MSERCPICGCTMVTVRGQYPGGPDRIFCPQCLLERLETIIGDINTFPAEAVK